MKGQTVSALTLANRHAYCFRIFIKMKKTNDRKGVLGLIERFTFKTLPDSVRLLLPLLIVTGLTLLAVGLLTSPREFAVIRQISQALGY